jgi:hypothetical protein
MLLLYFYCKLFLSINDVGREAAMGHNISLPVYDSKLKKKKKKVRRQKPAHKHQRR